MRVTVHRNVATFDAAAYPLLAADPVRHTLALTALHRLRDGAGAPALLLTVHRRGDVVGALLREEGRPALVSALPVRCADLAAAHADAGLDGVTGPVAEAEAYAAAHSARTGASVAVARSLRLFRLVTLTTPPGGRGVARVAQPPASRAVSVPGSNAVTRGRETGDSRDIEVVAAWQQAFAREALGQAAPTSDPRPGIVASMRGGAGHLLWEVDGRPVAYAAARRPVGGMSRIGPVYTPPEHRGHGLGSAVTAAAAAWAAGAGAREVVLFTDLSNPVSNAIYPRLGFRPVYDACELRCTPGGGIDAAC